MQLICLLALFFSVFTAAQPPLSDTKAFTYDDKFYFLDVVEYGRRYNLFSLPVQNMSASPSLVKSDIEGLCDFDNADQKLICVKWDQSKVDGLGSATIISLPNAASTSVQIPQLFIHPNKAYLGGSIVDLGRYFISKYDVRLTINREAHMIEFGASRGCLSFIYNNAVFAYGPATTTIRFGARGYTGLDGIMHKVVYFSSAAKDSVEVLAFTANGLAPPARG